MFFWLLWNQFQRQVHEAQEDDEARTQPGQGLPQGPLPEGVELQGRGAIVHALARHESFVAREVEWLDLRQAETLESPA